VDIKLAKAHTEGPYEEEPKSARNMNWTHGKDAHRICAAVPGLSRVDDITMVLHLQSARKYAQGKGPKTQSPATYLHNGTGPASPVQEGEIWGHTVDGREPRGDPLCGYVYKHGAVVNDKQPMVPARKEKV